jgi:signal transduction histidine kinase
LTPPRRDSLEEARRKLDEAAGALDEMRRFTGGPVDAGAPIVSASEGVKREALAAARDDLRRLSADLETERARGAALIAEVGRLREELAARPTAVELTNARAASESEANRRAAELAHQIIGLKERVALLSAEHVRLEALRRKAEAFGADSEASRRSLGEALRRDLRAAHAALDRAAADAGTRDAKAVTEIEEMRKRLDHALNRLQLEEREKVARKQTHVEIPSVRDDLEASLAVIAALRRELSEQRADALRRENALELRAHGLERRLISADASSFKGDFDAAQIVIASLRRELSEHRAEAQARASAASVELESEAARNVSVEYPAIEYALEPGWAKLLDIVKPPLQAAYGHLRRLSAGPMSAGQRAILRLTGSSLSQAADSLATIELALADSPATTEMAPLLPVLESALAAWDAVLRRRGIALTREISRDMPDSPHDPLQLRLALHHVLRNAVEALPRGAALRVHLRKAASGAVEIEFQDDGPGYPPAWLERQFEPFASPRQGHAGLGLAAVRRALRRWGGDAAAAAVGQGHGARLTLTFAPAIPRPAAKA